MTAKILKIVGFRKSGKTALIEALSGEFVKRGFRVAALKTTSHEHDFDRPGTDTWRYRKAGCESAALVSPGEFVCHAGGIVNKQRLKIYDVLYEDIDLLLMEGAGDFEAPMIECLGSTGEIRCAGDDELLAVVSDFEIESRLKKFKPDSIAEIADFIIDKLNIKKAGSSPA
jgi:molybdopterin-guanine dinucleotide biosynthesis protein B